MHASLVPCVVCQRHIRAGEASCPFCNAAIEVQRTWLASGRVARLSRAALFTVGATLAGVTTQGCGGTASEETAVEAGDETQGGEDSDAAAPEPEQEVEEDDGGQVAAYGGPGAY